MSYSIHLVTPQNLPKYLETLAHLRITIFREWPYLYEGSLAYEKEYLQTYLNSPDSLLILAEDNAEVVGAISGLPISQAIPETQAPFIKAQRSLENIYYLGEILLLPPHRNKGIGTKLYQTFEEEVCQKERYDTLTLCEIERPHNDPRRPPSSQPLDALWKRLGYQKSPHLKSYHLYQEIGFDQEIPHEMVYWEKTL